MLTGNKPLPEPMLAHISCHHMMASSGHNEISSINPICAYSFWRNMKLYLHFLSYLKPEMAQVWLKCHWSLFLRVQFTIGQHWFMWWLGTRSVPSHHLNQWWPSSMTHICISRPHWVNFFFSVNTMQHTSTSCRSGLCTLWCGVSPMARRGSMKSYSGSLTYR